MRGEVLNDNRSHSNEQLSLSSNPERDNQHIQTTNEYKIFISKSYINKILWGFCLALVDWGSPELTCSQLCTTHPEDILLHYVHKLPPNNKA